MTSLTPPADAAHSWVVFDDDPTGTQPIAEVPVITDWRIEDFEWAFARSPRVLYVLTNTRAMEPESTRRLIDTATRNARTAASGRRLSFLSRGDSTLRGHFPLEANTIAAALPARTGRGGRPAPPVIVFAPAYLEAGRITRDGEQLLREGDRTRPVDTTEYARDATFGYRSSHLPSHILEKDPTARPDQIRTIGLDALRSHGAAAVVAAVEDPGIRYVVCDAVSEPDLEALAAGLELARRGPRNLVVHSGPSLPRRLAGMPPPALFRLRDRDADGRSGGLIVVGSHVPTTTRQLDHLQRHASDRLESREYSPELLAATPRPGSRLPELREPSLGADPADLAAHIRAGGIALISTARNPSEAPDPRSALEFSRRVSLGLMSAARQVLLRSRPRFVVAKGGITSAHTATEALRLSRAVVRGPVLPGIISAWEPHDGLHPGVPLIVFAGNVGEDSALTDVVERLTAHHRPATGAEGDAS